MPEITFATSYDKVERMLNLATRIHSEVLERIDNKFTIGVDASIQSLNSVNGSDALIKTSHLTYQKQKLKRKGDGDRVEYEAEHYTLAELTKLRNQSTKSNTEFLSTACEISFESNLILFIILIWMRVER